MRVFHSLFIQSDFSEIQNNNVIAPFTLLDCVDMKTEKQKLNTKLIAVIL